MAQFDPTTHTHRRFNPLTNEHILVSPHRTKRPWLGQTESTQVADLPEYDPRCYLCPGNTRSGGQENPKYEHTYTFENDFAALLPSPIPSAPTPSHPFFSLEPVHGACDVLIFHPRHDLTLARFSVTDIERIIDEWIRLYTLRGAQEGIKYVQIFENKGAIMGCSNPHPHGQVWSLSEVPTLPATELASLQRYRLSNVSTSDAPKGPQGRPCLLCDYVHMELQISENDSRVVVHNDDWVALVPWWATWPFEILVLPHQRHIPSISTLSAPEKLALAEILAKITKKYDNLFTCSFAYSMGVHQRPVPPSRPQAEGLQDGDEDDAAHLHLHFTPPLLRSASVKKFLVGFELMAEPQRDLTAEQAAERLRNCAEVHYLDSN
ncbi:galactose-1-phosphate uridylyltransferase [Tricholoma matsutake]|nr:galactose-1-phosphate uridylyltransferase [Tricholoma matsutake 945]